MQGIILIGFMGAGKTTIGKVLAEKTGVDHIDLDEKIEEEIGITIEKYFDLYGEASFREKEGEVLKKYSGENQIISTGGGIILKDENRKLLKKMPHVVYLKTSPEFFISRIKEDNKVIRPLALSKSPEEIIRIFQERISFYQESANMVVETDGKSPEEIADEVLSRLDFAFNQDRPKICVPILGETEDQILKDLELLNEDDIDFDVIEWRLDYFNAMDDFRKVEEILQRMKKLNKVLLFTLRSYEQGGFKKISQNQYFSLNHLAIESGLIDLIDIELFQNQEQVKRIVRKARENKVKVIISHHDFEKTPPKEEILHLLDKMQDLGADITKIALMPQIEKDVLTLLEATLEMKKTQESQPIITISMGNLGKISRLTGQVFGSCMTYGALKESSATGQINIKDLSRIVNILKP